jgi:CarD family transcriptional regulator
VRLTTGNKVIYPAHGPCLIGPVVEKVVADRPVWFYHLALLDESGGELYVPVDKAEAAGIRVLLKRSEIPNLLSRLGRTAGAKKDWKQRASDHLKLLSSGSAFDLAEIVETLTERRETKSLSFRENRVLEKAKKLLVCEISEVTGETRSAVEGRVDQVLKARNKGRKLPL